MPVDAPILFRLFHSLQFLLSCWAGVAPCGVGTFAHWASRGEPFHSLLPAVFGFVQLRTIATCLGCVTLSADVLIMTATEALFYPAGAVVKLALVYLAFPYHTGINDGVGHFWSGKFDDDGRRPFERAFSGQPADV